jgi:transcription elongation GreA/GreB family factor
VFLCGFHRLFQKRPSMSESSVRNELEMRVLTLLEQSPAVADDWLGVLRAGAEAGVPEATQEWAEMAQEVLAKDGNVDGGLAVLKWRAVNTPIEQMTGRDWVRAAEVFAGTDPHLRTLIQEAGFGQPLAARECVRRLRLLVRLQPGTLCFQRTWGFGVVQRVDTLYRKIEIDFRGRPGHGLAMKVAAETLEILEEEHLLARWHRERAVIQQMVREAPTDVVKLALASFGPMPAPVLQETLVQAGVVAEADWKRFWEAARKGLKADPLVEVPSKRTEPIRLLDSAGGDEDAWFDRLANERDIAAVLDLVRDFAERLPGGGALTPAQAQVVGGRLNVVLRAATSRQPGYRLMGAMLAARLNIATDVCDWAAVAPEFYDSARLLDVLHDLPVRELSPVLEFLWKQDAGAMKVALLDNLPRLHFTPLQKTMDFLLAQGLGDECRQVFAAACAQLDVGQEMLLWMLRNAKQAAAWDLPALPALTPLILDELEQDYMGERLKTQKMLRADFSAADSLEVAFGGMTPGRQRDVFQRVNTSPAWSALDRKVVQARILKRFPHLQSVLTGDVDAAPVSTGRVTSQRSYRDRQEQLDKLIHQDIPANSKEIAVARSYGDLSENFEYKAAKDMQAVLLARRSELEQMMARVRPTDFSQSPKDVAGIGTTVSLEYADGRREQYHILGEWDQLPEKHIISSTSRLAQALAGQKVGATVSVPTEAGTDEECVVRAIEDLPPEIKEWVK